MRKLLSLLAVLMLSLGVLSGTALAQDDTTYCGDLSSDDCALLTDANAAMAEVTEGTFEFDMQINADGPEPFDLGLNLAGAYARNADAIPNFEELNFEEVTLQEAIDLVQTALGAFSADVTLSLTLPEEAQAEGLPAELMIESRYVDSAGYINMDTLPADIPLDASGWHGMDVSQAVRELAAFAGPESMDQSLSDLGFSMSDQTDQFTEIQTFIQDNPSDFLQVQRLEDSTVNGNNVAVFEISVDLATLASNEQFREAIRTQIESQNTGMGMSADEIEEQMQEQLAVLQDAQPLMIQQFVGLDNTYVYQTDVDWTFENPEPSTDAPETLVLDISVSQDNFNEAPAIEAPANAVLHTVMELLGGMSGGMGGGTGTGGN